VADNPAILGGVPAFEKTFPIIRPSSDEAATPEFLDRVRDVLRSNLLSNVGIFVRQFEEALERRLRVDHVIATSSCTLGLILAIHALGLRGKPAALPSFTFNASGLACYWNDVRLRYVDIDETLTLDPEKLNGVRGGIRFILSVHMYGNPSDLEALDEWAGKRGIPVVYDAAHALGSSWKGRPLGGFGTAEVFSLSPTKLITTGEGGFVATNDAKLAESLRILRNYGNLPDYTCPVPGINARMSEINAALGIEMLKNLDRYVESRNRYVRRYTRQLAHVPGIQFQHVREGGVSSHKDFSVLVEPRAFGMDRDELAVALLAERIATKKYFFPPMHRLKAFRPEKPVRLPTTDRVSRRVLSLPIHNVMSEAEIDLVSDRIELIQSRAIEVKRTLVLSGGRKSS